jgi:hypothetical protein
MNHLAIYNKNLFDRDYIALMLDGDKTLGVKFSSRKTAPYQKLSDGDYVYLKESSGPLRGRVRVSHVRNEEFTSPEEIMTFLVEHSKEIGIESESQLMQIWHLNASKRYVCYWRMEMPETIQYPVSIQKRDRRSWVSGYEPTEEVHVAFL